MGTDRYRAESCVAGAMVKDTLTNEVVCICPIRKDKPDLALERAKFISRAINDGLAKIGGKR